MNTSLKLASFNRNAVLSATPAQLVVMLYDRLVLDLKRAELAQTELRWEDASKQLIHAQEIIAELQSSLKLDAWDGAPGLFGIYVYVNTALIAANVNRDVARTKEAIALIEPISESWREAAAAIPTTAGASRVG